MASIEALHPRERFLSSARYAGILAGLWRPRTSAGQRPARVHVTGPKLPAGVPIADLASRRVDTSLNDASRRVCRAMLLLAPLRESQDPEMRAAYENIHDVMADLASIHHWNALVSMHSAQAGRPASD